MILCSVTDFFYGAKEPDASSRCNYSAQLAWLAGRQVGKSSIYAAVRQMFQVQPLPVPAGSIFYIDYTYQTRGETIELDNGIKVTIYARS